MSTLPDIDTLYSLYIIASRLMHDFQQHYVM
jgi:hypothetical protein